MTLASANFEEPDDKSDANTRGDDHHWLAKEIPGYCEQDVGNPQGEQNREEEEFVTPQSFPHRLLPLP
jgi:hypothetical protein